jgi:hypothetical protein
MVSDDTDAVGLPKMQLNYQLTDGDRRRLQQAVAVTERVGRTDCENPTPASGGRPRWCRRSLLPGDKFPGNAAAAENAA